ncbi:MAG: 3-phosphoshikimate 1-carboxyvinyltransferase [Dehalococcoidia bacterium]
MNCTISSPPRLRGTIVVPGDKSISHRAAVFNAIAAGEATIEGFPASADCLATLRCLRALGVTLRRRGGSVSVGGVGRRGLRESGQVLDAANSGTAARLLAGLLAGQPFLSVITGDASLRSRPMGRIIQPLRAMGAQVWGRGKDSLAPLVIRGGPLRGMHYRLPVASAQVKSALTLAALYAEGKTVLEEPAPSRDHTERMLQAMGARLTAQEGVVRVWPLADELRPRSSRVPGDISAAAFWLVAAAIHPDAELELPGVGVNPTRSGIIDVLRSMGADIALYNQRDEGGEPVADIVVRSSRLRGAVVAGVAVPRLIDEIPVVAVAAAVADGETVVRDAAELRVKESDRIRTTVEELSRLGAKVEERPDGMIVRGVGELRGAACYSHRDHRLAMALAVAGLVAKGETTIAGSEAAAVSYPAFWQDLQQVTAGERRLAPSLRQG